MRISEGSIRIKRLMISRSLDDATHGRGIGYDKEAVHKSIRERAGIVNNFTIPTSFGLRDHIRGAKTESIQHVRH